MAIVESTATALAACAVIGSLAVGLAIPGAWLIARHRGAQSGFYALVASLLTLPLLLPSYLAYAGYSIIRSPGTWLGDTLAKLPTELNVAANKATAGFGLALWLYPLASVPLIVGFSKISQESIDALNLAGAGRLTITRHILAMARGALLAAFGLVCIVLLGSAVPLHLAQVVTPAIDAWTKLSLGQTASAHLAITPLLAVAGLIAGGLWLRRRAAQHAGHALADDDVTAPTGEYGQSRAFSLRPGLVRSLAAAIWCVAVPLPMALLAYGLPSVHACVTHVKLNSPSIISSLINASWVGMLAGGLGLGAMFLTARSRPWALISSCLHWGLVATMLVPGVFVGSWLRWACSQLPAGSLCDWLDTSGALLIIAHLLRCGAIATWIGSRLVTTQESSLRDAGALSGSSWQATWRTIGLRYWPIFGAVAVVCALLSLYEIEATVMLQPAGVRPLAQRLLELLHYNRDEELSVMGLVIALMGLAGSACVGLLATLVVRPSGGLMASRGAH